MLPPKSFMKSAWYYILWGALLLAIAATYTSIATNTISKWYFYNADTLTTPAIYNDLREGYNLLGWEFEASRAFFPDVLLYVVIHALVGNLHLALMLYGGIQMLLLIIGFIVLSNAVFTPHRTIHALILVASISVLLVLATGKCPAFVPLLLPDYRTGDLVMTIYALYLMVRIFQSVLKQENLKMGLSVIILFLCVTLTLGSDMLYMLQFFIPVLGSLLLCLICSAISARQTFWAYAPLALALPVSDWLVQRLPQYRVPAGNIAKLTPTALWQQGVDTIRAIFQWEAWNWWSPQFLPIFQGLWLLFSMASLIIAGISLKTVLQARQSKPDRLTMIVLILSFGGTGGIFLITMLAGQAWLLWSNVLLLLMAAVVVFSRKTVTPPIADFPQNARILFILSFFLFSLLSMIGGALITGAREPRYFLPTILIPVFWGWPFLIGANKPLLRWFERTPVMVALTGITLGFIGWFGGLQNFGALSQLTDYYPEFVRCLDQQTQLRNLRYGFAQYWDAKPISLLSKRRMHVVQVRQRPQGELTFEHFGNNIEWYHHEFEFVLVHETHDGRAISEDQIIERFGPPADTFTCPREEGGLQKVLVYNRKTDREFQQQFTPFFYGEFAAAELPSQTGRVNGTSRIADERTSPPGYVTYGPYARVFVGKYAFEIHYSAQLNASKQPVGSWDIINWEADDQAQTLQQGTIHNAGTQIIAGEFMFPGHRGKLELRTFYSGQGTLTIDRIILRRLW